VQARKPTVYVAERAPALDGHTTAKLLSGKLQTVCIPDAAVSAVMSRIHQVVIGVQDVCADGSAIAQAGTYAVVLAARSAGIPVVVLTNALKVQTALMDPACHSWYTDTRVQFIPKSVASPTEASSLALAHKAAPHEILPLSYLEAHPDVCSQVDLQLYSVILLTVRLYCRWNPLRRRLRSSLPNLLTL
jgi:hypothetical protein